MIKRIMLTTDGSITGERAVPYAQLIAAAQGAEVLIAQVVDLPLLVSEDYEGGADWTGILETLEATADANLEALGGRLRTAGINAEPSRLIGSPAGALLDFEKEKEPGLVVMASHGRTGFARFALGSVADRIVRHGTAPVLLVRDAMPEARLDTALVMLDGSGLAEEALKAAKLLAGQPLQTVKLFQAVTDPIDRKPAKTYLEGVAARLAKIELDADVSTDIGDPTVLFEQASEGTDFTILATHGRGGLDRIRHGSVAERVVHESRKPVLLMRAGLIPE